MCSECLLRFSKKTHVSVWYCSSISPVCTSLLNASQRGFYSIPFVLLINTGVTRIKEKNPWHVKIQWCGRIVFLGGRGWELVSHLLDLEVHHVSCITFNSHIIIWSYVWGIPISELSLHDDSHLSIVAALVQWWLTLQLQNLNCWLCLLLKFWLLWGAFFSTLLNAFIYSVLCNLSNRNNYRI